MNAAPSMSFVRDLSWRDLDGNSAGRVGHCRLH